MLIWMPSHGLLKGRTVGVDATTLEANAAMRSIVRRDTGESYEESLIGLAKASRIETPTREGLARLDRKRLLPRRGELVGRPFAHLYETGGMRRTHLRGHTNTLKRLLIHAWSVQFGPDPAPDRGRG
jgi:hypothetical protein